MEAHTQEEAWLEQGPLAFNKSPVWLDVEKEVKYSLRKEAKCAVFSHNEFLYGCQFNHLHPDFYSLFVSVGRNQVFMFDVSKPGKMSLVQHYVLEDERERLCCCSWAETHDGTPMVLAAGKKGVIYLFDANKLQPMGIIPSRHGQYVSSLCSHPKQPNLVLTSSYDNSVRIYDVDSRTCLAVMLGVHGHRLAALDARWTLDGDGVVSGSMDRSVRVWDTPLEWLQRLQAKAAACIQHGQRPPKPHSLQKPSWSSHSLHSNFVDSVADLGGGVLLTKSTQSELIMWQPLDRHREKYHESVRVISTLKMHDRGTRPQPFFLKMGFDAGRRCVAAGDSHGRVFVWDLRRAVGEKSTACVKLESSYSNGCVRQVAWDYHGRTLVHVTENGRVFRWDLKSSSSSIATSEQSPMNNASFDIDFSSLSSPGANAVQSAIVAEAHSACAIIRERLLHAKWAAQLSSINARTVALHERTTSLQSLHSPSPIHCMRGSTHTNLPEQSASCHTVVLRSLLHTRRRLLGQRYAFDVTLTAHDLDCMTLRELKDVSTYLRCSLRSRSGREKTLKLHPRVVRAVTCSRSRQADCTSLQSTSRVLLPNVSSNPLSRLIHNEFFNAQRVHSQLCRLRAATGGGIERTRRRAKAPSGPRRRQQDEDWHQEMDEDDLIRFLLDDTPQSDDDCVILDKAEHDQQKGVMTRRKRQAAVAISAPESVMVQDDITPWSTQVSSPARRSRRTQRKLESVVVPFDANVATAVKYTAYVNLTKSFNVDDDDVFPIHPQFFDNDDGGNEINPFHRSYYYRPWPERLSCEAEWRMLDHLAAVFVDSVSRQELLVALSCVPVFPQDDAFSSFGHRSVECLRACWQREKPPGNDGPLPSLEHTRRVLDHLYCVMCCKIGCNHKDLRHRFRRKFDRHELFDVTVSDFTDTIFPIAHSPTRAQLCAQPDFYGATVDSVLGCTAVVELARRMFGDLTGRGRQRTRTKDGKRSATAVSNTESTMTFTGGWPDASKCKPQDQDQDQDTSAPCRSPQGCFKEFIAGCRESIARGEACPSLPQVPFSLSPSVETGLRATRALLRRDICTLASVFSLPCVSLFSFLHRTEQPSPLSCTLPFPGFSPPPPPSPPSPNAANAPSQVVVALGKRRRAGSVKRKKRFRPQQSKYTGSYNLMPYEPCQHDGPCSEANFTLVCHNCLKHECPHLFVKDAPLDPSSPVAGLVHGFKDYLHPSSTDSLPPCVPTGASGQRNKRAKSSPSHSREKPPPPKKVDKSDWRMSDVERALFVEGYQVLLHKEVYKLSQDASQKCRVCELAIKDKWTVHWYRKYACACVRRHGNSTHCDKYCGCDQKCARRFAGCQCRGGCVSNSCSCYVVNRECDPDRCVNCAGHVHPEQRLAYMDSASMSAKPCQNQQLTWSKTSKPLTAVGRSTVAGLGLFAIQECSKSNLVGEYTGHLIADDEMERRGHIHDKTGVSYGFDVSTTRGCDPMHHGSRLKFVNGAQGGNENCYPLVVYAQGELCLALFAKRNISTMEELFFYYGPQHDVLQMVEQEDEDD